MRSGSVPGREYQREHQSYLMVLMYRLQQEKSELLKEGELVDAKILELRRRIGGTTGSP